MVIFDREDDEVDEESCEIMVVNGNDSSSSSSSGRSRGKRRKLALLA